MHEGRDRSQYRSPPDLAELGRRLAQTYTRGAEVLEQTAGLAEAHADRDEQQGRTESAATERANAARAWDAAARFPHQRTPLTLGPAVRLQCSPLGKCCCRLRLSCSGRRHTTRPCASASLTSPWSASAVGLSAARTASTELVVRTVWPVMRCNRVVSGMTPTLLRDLAATRPITTAVTRSVPRPQTAACLA